MLMSKAANTVYAEEATYVKTRRRKRKKQYSPMVKSSVFAISIVCMILIYLLLQSVIMTMGYQRAQVEDRLLSVRNDHRALTVEVNRLKSLGRIESVAKTELNMVKPEDVKVLSVKGPDYDWSGNVDEQVQASTTIISMEDNIRLKETVYDAVLGLLSNMVMSWFGDSLSYFSY